MNLQLFPRPVGDIGLGAFSAEGPVITLQDLIQLDMRVTWDEAVSIIQELCAAAQGAVMRPIPQANDIILNAAGTVSMRQSAGGVPDPVEAARRLHELLGGSVAPAPLRLFISQAVSSNTYNSLSEFEDALEYYAKPGRQDRVKAVYQRASEQLLLNPPSEKAQTPHKPVTAPPPPPYGARALALAQHPHRRLVMVGVAAAGIATMVVGMGLYLWPQGSSASTAAAPTPAVETPAAPAPETAPGTAPAATVAGRAPKTPTAATAANRAPVTRSGFAAEVAAIPLTGSAAAINYTGSRSNWLQRGTRTSGDTARRPAAASVGAAPAEGVRLDAGVQPGQPAGGGAVEAGAAPGVQTINPSTGEPPQTLYSANDASVRPALLSKPQLLPPPYADRFGKPVRLELIISPEGTVERARFIEAPQRMADMMILSSAKTWQFTPAVKDGQPVRYRTVLSWMAAP